MTLLKVLAFVFLIPGVSLAFAARWIVESRKLYEKVHCEYEDELSAEEVAKYKKSKAVVNLKMLGMLVALPGIILVLVSF